MIVIICHWFWFERYYLINKEEYEWFDSAIQKLDDLAHDCYKQGVKHPRFYCSELECENTTEQVTNLRTLQTANRLNKRNAAKHYLNVMEKGMYKIAWCPLCEQGWVVIVKDKQTSQLYAYCTECETEWNDPTKGIKEESCLPFGAFGQFVPPTFEEISKSDWYKYIKESDNEQQTD